MSRRRVAITTDIAISSANPFPHRLTQGVARPYKQEEPQAIRRPDALPSRHCGGTCRVQGTAIPCRLDRWKKGTILLG